MKSARAQEETCDTILNGRIRVIQPKYGYRFSADSILLGTFARISRGARVIELGAGCGVITMMLAALHRSIDIAAIEIQENLATMVRRNADLNQLAMVRAVHGDLRKPHPELKPASFDVVIANPPFRARGSGRQSPNHARNLARSEHSATAEDFAAAASRYARSAGSAAFVFAADRAAHIIAILRAHRLEPKRIRFVHPYCDSPASSILIEARKDGGVEATIEPPLIMFDARGVYSGEAAELLGSASIRTAVSRDEPARSG